MSSDKISGGLLCKYGNLSFMVMWPHLEVHIKKEEEGKIDPHFDAKKVPKNMARTRKFYSGDTIFHFRIFLNNYSPWEVENNGRFWLIIEIPYDVKKLIFNEWRGVNYR